MDVFHRVTFSLQGESGKRKADEERENVNEILVEPYIIPNRGPYPYNKPKM